MRIRRVRRSVSLVMALAMVLSLGVFLGGGEGIQGIGTGESVEVKGIVLAKYGVPVSVMGQLTRDGEPVPGSFFFLAYDPLGNTAESNCGMQLEHTFPEGTVANGAQISYIQFPNAIVTFNIGPSQFKQGLQYELPFLPEDPPGQAALEFL